MVASCSVTKKPGFVYVRIIAHVLCTNAFICTFIYSCMHTCMHVSIRKLMHNVYASGLAEICIIPSVVIFSLTPEGSGSSFLAVICTNAIYRYRQINATLRSRGGREDVVSGSGGNDYRHSLSFMYCMRPADWEAP